MCSHSRKSYGCIWWLWSPLIVSRNCRVQIWSKGQLLGASTCLIWCGQMYLCIRTVGVCQKSISLHGNWKIINSHDNNLINKTAKQLSLLTLSGKFQPRGRSSPFSSCSQRPSPLLVGLPRRLPQVFLLTGKWDLCLESTIVLSSRKLGLFPLWVLGSFLACPAWHRNLHSEHLNN